MKNWKSLHVSDSESGEFVLVATIERCVTPSDVPVGQGWMDAPDYSFESRDARPVYVHLVERKIKYWKLIDDSGVESRVFAGFVKSLNRLRGHFSIAVSGRGIGD